MARKWSVLAGAALLAGLTGCSEYLTGGELSKDPNRPTTATNRQLFVGVQTLVWQLYASDLTRIVEIWAQHGTGNVQQYRDYARYEIDESVTNTQHSGLYGSGGLVDVRKLQDATRAAGDSLFLGIAQVQEALIMSMGADFFGDLVYSEALKGDEAPNPPLDPQLDVYDALVALLDEAMVNLSRTGPTNVGPGTADLAYEGDRTLWTKLAHTLKARILLHTAEVRPTVYAQVLTEARLGITRTSENLVAPFSGGAGEQNFWYQFLVVEREGYWIPNVAFVQLLETRGDPRRTQYFNAAGTNLSAERLDPGFTQPLITAGENLLTWAEAAYRTGATGEALTQLNAARALVPLPAISPTGTALLREILTEKYIATFQTNEGWNDYKRTCFPNLTPTVAGASITARLFYDTAERNTNSSIPSADEQPARNANDPPNATDPFGNACLGQRP
jgi:starch-binding outer membrane protein, SusD/RagB family